MSDNPPDTDPEGGATPDPTLPIDSLAASGSSLGPFLLRERIGTGGMGEVWKAEQTSPVRRTVALKLIKAGMDSREVLARFEAERQALALMDHPCIAKVFDAGITPQGRSWFAMEYVQGTPITEYCDRRRRSTQERLELFQRVCEGVQHAHQKAVLHRDLKPGNVLVADVDGQPLPKIIDFGVAKATTQKLTERTIYTAMGQLIGTPEYMSPEQAELTGEDVDTRTDVYSLGVILYELLVGALPFEAKELRMAGFEGIVRMLREQDPPRPSTRLSTLGEETAEIAAHRRTGPKRLSSQLKGDLDWIVMRCLEKDRNRRYGSPQELAQDIGRHLRHEPVLASPPSVAYRMRKFVRRHRVGVTAASFVTLAVILGIAGTTVGMLRARKAEEVAKREAAVTEEVSDFMTKIFESSNPWARGDTLKVVDILEQGARSIAVDLQDQPLLKARLLHTIGEAYESLGLPGEALPFLQEAADIRERILGEENLETAKSNYARLAAIFAAGRYDLKKTDEMVEEGKRILKVQKKLLPAHHEDIIRTQTGLGFVLFNRGDFESAEQYYRDALSSYRMNPHAETGHTLLSFFSLLLARVGKYDELATIMEERMELVRRLKSEPGSDRSLLARAEHGINHDMGYLMLKKGEYDKAIPYYERALAIKQEHVGAGNSNLGYELNSLSICYAGSGDLAMAISLAEEAMSVRQQYGARSVLALGMKMRVADLCLQANRPERTRAMFEEVWQTVQGDLELLYQAATWFLGADSGSDLLRGEFHDFLLSNGEAAASAELTVLVQAKAAGS